MKETATKVSSALLRVKVEAEDFISYFLENCT